MASPEHVCCYHCAIITCRNKCPWPWIFSQTIDVCFTLRPYQIVFDFVTAEEKQTAEATASDDEIVVVYELTPTAEQRALAAKLQLPPTFFCYKSKPDYVSEDEEDGKFFEI